MFRLIVVIGVAVAALIVPGVNEPSIAVASELGQPPERALSVSGQGVAMYPAFDQAVLRYALTTTQDTGGAVTVAATTSDPVGVVRVNGRVAANGTATLNGLDSGDEISVFITDSDGVHRYALIYLPAGFPTLQIVTKQPGIESGYVGLTMSQWTNPATTNFDAIVDSHGVPIYVHPTVGTDLDLKRQDGEGGGGQLTVQRPTTTSGRSGDALVVLDDQYNEVARYETKGLDNTDGHDAILLQDGSRILLASETNSTTGLVDAVIQKIDSDDNVEFQWDSSAFASQSVVTNADYAHVNSIWLTPGGDILASFRHLSSVLLIAGHAHDGFAAGDVEWQLGGRNSSFTFPNDPDGGPCAQHDATLLPNGHVLLFDDGSGGVAPNYCVDPANPNGPPIARTRSRVTEYALDTTNHTATLVWKYDPHDRYAFFMGSARRLTNGNTLIGWASANQALASEVSPAGDLLWELKALPDAGNHLYISYRAAKFDMPDAIKPAVNVTSPASGATYAFGEHVTVDFSCADRGGSSLQTCGDTVLPGSPLDTSAAGAHTFNAVATDGAGNTTTVTRKYTVGAPPKAQYRPDGLIRASYSPHLTGDNVYGAWSLQFCKQAIHHRGGTRTAIARLQNDGEGSELLVAKGTTSSRSFAVTYFFGTKDVTSRIVAGTFRTPRLAPGSSSAIRIKVTRLGAARVHDSRTFRLTITSHHDSGLRDAVATVVHAD